jgi:hypothetical protein
VGFNDTNEMITTLSDHPELKLLLIDKEKNSEYLNYVYESIDSGTLKLIAEMGRYLVVEVPAH